MAAPASGVGHVRRMPPHNQAGGDDLRGELDGRGPLVKVIQPRNTAQKHKGAGCHQKWKRKHHLAGCRL